jgi:hypothetical protein
MIDKCSHACAGNPCEAEAPAELERVAGALRRNRVARQGLPDQARLSPQLFASPGSSGSRPSRAPPPQNGLRRSVCIQACAHAPTLPPCTAVFMMKRHAHGQCSVAAKGPPAHQPFRLQSWLHWCSCKGHLLVAQEVPPETPSGLAYRARQHGLAQSVAWEARGDARGKQSASPASLLSPVDLEYRWGEPAAHPISARMHMLPKSHRLLILFHGGGFSSGRCSRLSFA